MLGPEYSPLIGHCQYPRNCTVRYFVTPSPYCGQIDKVLQKGYGLLTFDDGCIIAISERTWFLERIRGSLMLVEPRTAHWDLSPDGFHLWATQYQKAGNHVHHIDPEQFSPVPYFLLCLAIELEIKAKLLRRMKPMDLEKVKKCYGHFIIRAYEALDTSEKVLNPEELDTLQKASDLYSDNKQFEYFCVENLEKEGYKNFPKLTSLSSIANKLIGGVIPGDGDIAD